MARHFTEKYIRDCLNIDNNVLIKPIPNYEDLYYATSDGRIITLYFREPRFKRTYIGKSGYEFIDIYKNKEYLKTSVHRLVALTFLPNENNLPEVNHKNKIRNDNRLENLEWCTRKENLYQSYETMSPVRNFKKCEVRRIDTDELVYEAESIIDAARYCNKNFGCSITGMQKHYKSKNYYLVKKQ